MSELVALRTIAPVQTASTEPRASKGIDSMIEQQPAVDTTVLSLSDAAATKLRELTKEETNPNIGLRVYVYSGGCSGFRYGMMLEDQPTPEDNVLEVNGTKVYVDGQSIPLLKGSEIDYVDTLMGAGLHRQQPERRHRLRLRLELPDGGRRGHRSLLRALNRIPFRGHRSRRDPGGFLIHGTEPRTLLR